ncbi:hypothetical protein LWI29_024727 [Acer saccharum]|uniref:Legume lectin domain-containing protein n=1 Tax=Acer saccharum TaxID=4024 RepID=A0AA39TDJ1_ACESA|nr:hypothetical protein LWI29_024727 [Acer saccharum]
MDVNDLKPLGFHKKKSILCFLCFVFHFPSLHAISFNYPNFSNITGIKTSGDASFTSNGTLSLTKNQADLTRESSVGRAVYAEEMHLWDAGTGQIADFSTHFSFNISQLPGGSSGDGLAFFLSPNGSQVPEGAWGECLALITNCRDFKVSEIPIVFVEFDTFKNNWDPNDNHVGININTMQSVKYLTWNTSIKNGSRANAWISYNSQTSNLSLFLTYLDNPVFLGNSSLSYKVNLSKVLPEWVSVGFSSATGTAVEVNYILSWEFNSTELISDQGEDAIPPASNNGNKAQGGANIGVVIGSVVGGLVLVGGIISTLVFGWRKRSRKAEDQESTVESDDHSIDNKFEHGMGPKRLMDNELGLKTTGLAGTFGYMAPEYISTANSMINRSSDAFITSNGILSLTKNQADLKREDSVGRAVYAEEMHLWDAGTGQMADFSTHFSFNISLLQAGWIGDGFTFFLSPNGSQVPELAWGGCLALITNCSNLNQSENPIVAVEFDTYKNDWDPSDNHVGIDINSIQSVTNLTWDTNITDGKRANAWISYNSQTTNLSLFLTYLDNPVFLGNSTLSYEVDLSKILPEWVSVGFSSSTGAGVEIHYILSWEFNSTELISNQTSNNENKAQGGANIGVVIGSVVGGLVLVGGIISTLVFGWRKRSRKAEDQESTMESDDHSIDNEFEHGMGPKSCRICSKSIIDMSRTWKRIDEEDSLAEEAKAKLEEMEPDREARKKKLCTSFLKGRL